MKKIWCYFVFVVVFHCLFSHLLAKNNFSSLFEKVSYYKSKFNVECASEKITDNYGNGFDSLYGTRNMRPVLHGILYRGGANNFYHRINKRNNKNPLPEDGLYNLLLQGFSSAIYLYATNFENAPKMIIDERNMDTLFYIQILPDSREDLRNIVMTVLNAIRKPWIGPIYLHCWNGWHQSGYVSAVVLMQFCNLSNQDALQYWIENTDGNHKGYEKIRWAILSFQTFEDVKITEEERKTICPCLK